MRYQNIFIVLSLLLLALPAYASAASFAINEVMYDLKEGSDSGREWIEVVNLGSGPLDLSTFKLYESGTAHGIKSVQGAASIPAGGYGVIADTPDKFLADNPGFSGNLFDSTFSLSNSGETISIKDPTNAVVDTLSYASTEGGAGDGSTLGKIGQDFVSTNPTPGAANTLFTESTDSGGSGAAADASSSTSTDSLSSDSSSDDGDTSDPSVVSISTTSHPSSVVSMDDDGTFRAGAGRERLVSVHSPLMFSALSSGVSTAPSTDHDKPLYQWSFGDGAEAYGPIVEHTYLFPGQYNVVLLAQANSGSQITSRTKVYVRQGGVDISEDLLAENGYVAVSNSNKEEVNIGGWSLDLSGDRVTLPDDTIISPQSTLRLSYSWPQIIYTDSHRILRTLSGEKLENGTTSVQSAGSLPREIDLEYPDGTLAASTTDIHTGSSIDVSTPINEKDAQIAQIQNALAAIRAELVKAFSLSASSTAR